MGRRVKILQNTPQTQHIAELTAFAETAYIHFKADSLQTQFSYLKRDLTNNKASILAVLEQELTITKRLLSLQSAYATIGFEASNHYYYNERNLIEKILQTQALQDEVNSL